jgi:hypothetical protein
MTADDHPEQIAAAREAVEQGMATAEAYWQAAATPGVGVEVRLPSYPIPSLPPVQGLGYAAGAEPVPMPGNPRLTLVPNYASPAVGGELHHGAPVARSNDAALWVIVFASSLTASATPWSVPGGVAQLFRQSSRSMV